MFFKKIIQKNIKLLVVLLFLIGISYISNTKEVFGADSQLLSMDLDSLSQNSNWEKRTGGEINAKENSWTTLDADEYFEISTSQYEQGLTAETGDEDGLFRGNNLNYSSVKSGLPILNGTYSIGTGELPSGYRVTVIYDKGTLEYDPLDDRTREIRVQKPDGTSYTYIWTGGNVITKEGSGVAGKVNDKEILNELGQKIGDSNLYNKITQQDIESKYSRQLSSIQASVNDSIITQADADKLRNSILNEKKLTDSEKAEIQPVINKINTRLQNVGRPSSDLLSIGEGNVIRTVSQNNIATANVATAAEATGIANKESDANYTSRTIGQCFETGDSFLPEFNINLYACFIELLYFILSILAFLLGVVGLFFNLVFDVTLVNMKENVRLIGIVDAGWVTIRDMANILFIFMLLYLAISTILQLDEHGVKHGLSRLIIGAVLINFSLFFVKIPIDVSNILAIEIYDKIVVTGNNTVENDSSAGISFGLGDAVMAMFSPQQVFNNGSFDPKTVIKAGNNFGETPNQIGWNLYQNPSTTFAMGIIVMFTTMLVFLAVIIIFIKRFITLVMLMIFSPLAFAGMAVPSHDIEHQISDRFWGTLLKESFYAPVFMFMLYLTIKTGMAINTVGLAGSTSEGILANLTSVPVSNIISYTVVMGMMIFSLTISETMGVKGASGAIKFFDGARGMATNWTATNTIGRLAYTRANKGQSAADLARDASGQRGLPRQVIARTQLAILKNVGKGFGEKVHATEEYKKAYDAEMHNNAEVKAQMLMNDIRSDGTVNTLSSGLQANDAMAHHWDADENANVKLKLEQIKKLAEKTIKDSKDKKEIDDAKTTLNKADGALARYYTGDHGKKIHARLTPEMANKVARAEFGELDHYNDEFREILESHDKPEEIAKNIKEFIKNSKSEAAVVGALKSAGAAMNAMKGNTAGAQVIKQGLSDALRDKFNGEAAYANIAKDPIIDKEVRAAISAGGYYTKMTADLYDTLSDATKVTPELETKFKELLGKIENDKIKTAVISGNLKAMLDAYRDNKLGDDRPTQNFFSKDNGGRSQTQSSEIIRELADLESKGVKGIYTK